MAGSGGHGGDAGGMEWRKVSGETEGDRGDLEVERSQERAEKYGHQVCHIKRAGPGRVWKKGLFHMPERRKKLGFLRKELTGHQLSWSGRGPWNENNSGWEPKCLQGRPSEGHHRDWKKRRVLT